MKLTELQTMLGTSEPQRMPWEALLELTADIGDLEASEPNSKEEVEAIASVLFSVCRFCNYEDSSVVDLDGGDSLYPNSVALGKICRLWGNLTSGVSGICGFGDEDRAAFTRAMASIVAMCRWSLLEFHNRELEDVIAEAWERKTKTAGGRAA